MMGEGETQSPGVVCDISGENPCNLTFSRLGFSVKPLASEQYPCA